MKAIVSLPAAARYRDFRRQYLVYSVLIQFILVDLFFS